MPGGYGTWLDNVGSWSDGPAGSAVLLAAYPSGGVSISDTTGMVWSRLAGTAQAELWLGLCQGSGITGTLTVGGAWCFGLVASLLTDLDYANLLGGSAEFPFSLGGLGLADAHFVGQILLPGPEVSHQRRYVVSGVTGTRTPDPHNDFGDMSLALEDSPGGPTLLQGTTNVNPLSSPPSPIRQYHVNASSGERFGCGSAGLVNVIGQGTGPAQGVPGAHPAQSADATLLVVYLNCVDGVTCPGGGGGGTPGDDSGDGNDLDLIRHPLVDQQLCRARISSGAFVADRYSDAENDTIVGSATVDAGPGCRYGSLAVTRDGTLWATYQRGGTVYLVTSADRGRGWNVASVVATGYSRPVLEWLRGPAGREFPVCLLFTGGGWYVSVGSLDAGNAWTFSAPRLVVSGAAAVRGGLRQRADGVLEFIYQTSGNVITIVRCPGLSSAGVGAWV